MYPLLCEGPGPHEPADGVMGEADREGVPGGLCPLCAAAVPEPAPAPAEVVLAAVQTARSEVSGFSPTNGTRQAVEALATAVETLVTGA